MEPGPRCTCVCVCACVCTQHSYSACSTGEDQYGYACNREDTPGWQMSYTLTTSPVPPDNPCTRGMLASAVANQLPDGANGWAHFLIAQATEGYTRYEHLWAKPA